MALKDWVVDWKKSTKFGEVIRYHSSKSFKNLQIGKYRDADEFDKATNTKLKWHGKWYVNTWEPERIKLFKTKIQAKRYAKSYMRRNK